MTDQFKMSAPEWGHFGMEPTEGFPQQTWKLQTTVAMADISVLCRAAAAQWSLFHRNLSICRGQVLLNREHVETDINGVSVGSVTASVHKLIHPADLSMATPRRLTSALRSVRHPEQSKGYNLASRMHQNVPQLWNIAVGVLFLVQHD